NTSPGIECRTYESNKTYHRIIITFSSPVTGLPSVSVQPSTPNSTASISASSLISSIQIEIDISNVSNAQTFTVNLTGVSDGVNASVNLSFQMSVLLGDVDASGAVNAADVSAVKSQVKHRVSASNFRDDVNVSGGRINSTDLSIVK